MKEETPSRTALGTAYLRAAHQLLDTPPLLFDDPIALRLLGEKTAEIIRRHIERHQSKGGRALRCHVCLRSRFAEDRLREAAAVGASRYVLVGAGFDSFAWRQPDWAKAFAILEIDHPATQAAKREMIAKAGLGRPENLSFAAVDFTRETLAETLARAGLGRDEKVYFSWLGVSMYLEEAAIDASLRAMASFASGSGVTLTFMSPRTSPAKDTLAGKVAELGEALVSFFTPEAMAEKLRRCGFPEADFLTPDQVKSRYFTPLRRDLPLPRRTSIVYASK